MRIRIVFASIMMACFVMTSVSNAQRKIAQTGFQFLSVGTDARATALGEAFTTVEGSPMSLFYNPAGMARMNSFLEFAANHTPWIASIDYFTGGLTLSPDNGRYGVFGLSFMFVDYGEIIGTVVAANEQGFSETGDISPSAVMIGLGYSRALTDRFSVGGQVKFVTQSLGDPFVPGPQGSVNQLSFSASTVAFDFGTLYKTGLKSLVFGMTIRNFSREISFEREDFELPLTFKVGFSVNPLDFIGESGESQSFLLTVDAVNPRSFEEFFALGGEYTIMNVLSLRAGYAANQDDYGFSAGVGMNAKRLKLDYSYTPFDVLDDVHRFSVKFSR